MRETQGIRNMCPKDIRKYEIRKILVIGADGLPDNLLLTPAFKKIKDSFQNSSMDIIVGRESTDFVLENALFSESFIYDRSRNILKLVRKVRHKRYDLIIAFRDPFLPYLLRGKYRISFFWRNLFSEKIFTHESERVLDFLNPFFCKNEEKTNFYFPFSKRDREHVEEKLRSAGIRNSDTIVVVNPGFVKARKRLDSNIYAAVIDELIRIYDAHIIFIGTEEDKEIARMIIDLPGNANVHDFTGKLNIRQLTSLMEKSDLLITQDTVSMYLACSVQCSIAAVFGPGNPYRYGPLGTKNLVVHSNLDCFPCNVNVRCKKNYMCLEKITSEQIAKAAMLLLDEKEQPFLFEL